jgi:hypothetical protein
LLLNLRHNLIRNGASNDTRPLLPYQAIYHIEYLVAQASLTYRANTSRQGKRPEHRQGHNTYRAYSRFIQPSLLPNHRQHTAGGALKRYRERGLHTDNRLKVATLFQLYKHLIIAAYLLSLISLREISIHQIARQALYIYIFRVIKAGIHTLFLQRNSFHCVSVIS